VVKGQISRRGRDLHDYRLGRKEGESQNLRTLSRMSKENGDTDDMNNTKDSKDSKGAKDTGDTRDTQDSFPEGPSYLLDTSAIPAFYQDEPGASTIEDLFEKREKGLLRIYVSFISLFEILYLPFPGKVQKRHFLYCSRSGICRWTKSGPTRNCCGKRQRSRHEVVSAWLMPS